MAALTAVPLAPAVAALQRLVLAALPLQHCSVCSLSLTRCVPLCLAICCAGVKKYSEAVANLFDAATSRADLISIEVQDRRTVRLRWRLEGTLKLGNLRIKPYTGTTVYSTNEQGRVVRHVETWDISPLDVFVSLVNPNFGVPPAPPV